MHLAIELGNKEIVDILSSNGGIDFFTKDKNIFNELYKKGQELPCVISQDNIDFKKQFEIQYNFDEVDLEKLQSYGPLHSNDDFSQIMDGPFSGQILQAMDEMFIYEPSEIQGKVIPLMHFQKKDILVISPYSTGKTVASLVAMYLHVNNEINFPQAIYLCHSRELTLQTYEVFNQMNTYCQIKGDICCNNEEKQSPKDAPLLFGTPDSICSCIEKGIIDVSHVKFLVIDEADQILDKNNSYFNTTMKILKNLPKNTQYAFFSSSFSHNAFFTVLNMRKDITMIFKPYSNYYENCQHWYTKVTNEEDSMNCLTDLIANVKNGQILVFTRSNEKVKLLFKFLSSKNVSCVPYHSELNNEQKDENIRAFRENESKVLIGTDVLSRGIDFPNVFLVINYQMPFDSFDPNFLNKERSHFSDVYNHRASRAGRFARKGFCFTIVTGDEDENILKDFCRRANICFIKYDELKLLGS